MDFDSYKAHSATVLRIGLALVVLWFGLNQIFDSATWMGYLPGFVFNLPLSAETFILVNGIAEVVLGGLLLIGLFTRLSSGLLFLHLLGISVSLGYNDVMIRDLGLSIAMLAVFLHGPDAKTLDIKRNLTTELGSD
ncbi:MAG: DoxX family membrane protein [Nanoarchaeota archaeon]|nr:DoxX family membrane protein [Nanoarchaeota archaeon]